MRMAQAQISYRGTGNLADSAQPGWLNGFIQVLAVVSTRSSNMSDFLKWVIGVSLCVCDPICSC